MNRTSLLPMLVALVGLSYPHASHAASAPSDEAETTLRLGAERSNRSMFGDVSDKPRWSPTFDANYRNGRFFAGTQRGIGYDCDQRRAGLPDLGRQARRLCEPWGHACRSQSCPDLLRRDDGAGGTLGQPGVHRQGRLDQLRPKRGPELRDRQALVGQRQHRAPRTARSGSAEPTVRDKKEHRGRGVGQLPFLNVNREVDPEHLGRPLAGEQSRQAPRNKE